MKKAELIPWTRREGKRHVYEVGLLCNIVSLFCIFLSFVSPYWIQSWPRVFSQFKKIGLWEVCLAGLVLEMDPAQKSYHGCWWILAPEFKKITRWLMPSWFVWTQVAVTFCFVALMVVVGLEFWIWIRTGMTQRDPRIQRRRDPFVLLNVCCFATFGTGLVMAITEVMFAIKFKTDRYWLPNPNLNYLSWSYGFAVLSTFFNIGACIGHFTYLAIIKQEMREPPKVDPITMELWMGSVSQLSISSKENFGRSKENLNRSKENMSKSQENVSLMAVRDGVDSDA